MMRRLLFACTAIVLAAPSYARAGGGDEAGPDDGGEEENEGKEEAGKGDGDEVVEVAGRVHVGFDAEHEHHEENGWSETFHIRRARLKVTWKPEDWLSARVQIDASTVFAAGRTMVKDAWMKVEPVDRLELKGGLFKKPFSDLELTSSGKLRVVDRGVANALLVDSSQSGGGMFYGDRDIGIELSGRLVESVKLDGSLGVFNGSGVDSVDFDNAKDVVARIGMRPVKPLSFAISGTLRVFDDSLVNHPWMAAAGSADVRLKIAGFRAHVEGMIAHNFVAKVLEREEHPDVGDVDLAFGVLGVLSYEFEIPSTVDLSLEPVVKVEYLDPNDYIVDDHVMLYTVGLNTYVGKLFRVLIDLEIMRAERFWDIDSDADDPATAEVEDVEDNAERFLLLLCFDI